MFHPACLFHDIKLGYLYDLYEQYDENLNYILIDTYNIYNDEKIKISNNAFANENFMEYIGVYYLMLN